MAFADASHFDDFAELRHYDRFSPHYQLFRQLRQMMPPPCRHYYFSAFSLS
jgi:hypothetical protein